MDGDPIVSISANDKGLHVRFSNKDSIEDYYTDDDWYVDWDDATGEWVDVTISTVFGRSMEVSCPVLALRVRSFSSFIL